MTALLTVLAAILVSMPTDAGCRETPRFSPLAAGLRVAQASPADSLPVVRRQKPADVVPAGSDMVVAATDSIPSDSLRYSAQTPSGALYRSLALAGWGQWRNGRRSKALLFFAAEAVCAGGYLFENARYTSGDYTGADKDAIRTGRNTWLLYWMVAKVFGIMDAYVDAQFSSYDVGDITPRDLAR